MVDSNWRPSAAIDILRQRAQIMAAIRRFFSDKGYLEVETPSMGRFGVTDVYLKNIEASVQGKSYQLQTSPEYHMKRILASGSGPIFQLSRVFRDDELGRWHNPEFTMLEWYQLAVDHHGLMDEVDLFLQHILKTPPMERVSYQQVFLDCVGIDPFQSSIADLRAILSHHHLDGVFEASETRRDQYLFLLMSHVVERYIADYKAPVAIYDFPASQASLAKVNGLIGERFEIFYRGVELANGFHELTDVHEQCGRFDRDNEARAFSGIEMKAPDEYLIQALAHGLPSCSGVALGVDRLIALALNQGKLSDILAFDFSRC